MRILIVIPMVGYRHTYPSFLSMTNFPIGASYVAASLRAAGHEVSGLNTNNRTGFKSAPDMLQTLLTKAINEIQPEMVAIGGLCMDFPFIRDAIALIRRCAPDIPIVLGGGIVTNDAEFIFKNLRPDFAISGEAEEASVRLANLIASGESHYDLIPNIWYWRNGKAAFTEKSFEYCDLDDLPFPEYDLFDMSEMLDGYGFATNYFWRASQTHPRPMSIATARSCPYACTFCVHRETSSPYRSRSTKNVIEELGALYETYEFNTLIIVDELFAAKRTKLTEFCEALIERRDKEGWKFGWWFQTHANVGITKEDLNLAKEAGLCGWTYGLESGSPTVLKSMDKRSKPSQIIEAIKLSEEVQVTYGGLFIFGDPAETPETIKESFDFFKTHCVGHNMHLAYVKPYPGSYIYNTCLERGVITDRLSYYEYMDSKIFNMTSMPDEIWFPWINTLLAYEVASSWGRYVEASSCVEDIKWKNNSLAKDLNTPIWNIHTTCPWCSKEDRCRELLKRPVPKSPQTNPIGKRIRNTIKRLLSGFRKSKQQSASLKNNMFEQIKPAKMTIKHKPLLEMFEPFNGNFDITRSPSTFPTNCKNCGRRYYVGINWSTAQAHRISI